MSEDAKLDLPGESLESRTEVDPSEMSAPGGLRVFSPEDPPDDLSNDLSDPDEPFGDPELVERYGDPVHFTTTRDGERWVCGSNESYWAGDYAKNNTIIFEPNEDRYYCYKQHSGLYVPISKHAIKTAISKRLLEFSRTHPDLKLLERKRGAGALGSIVSQLCGIAEKRDAFVRTIDYIHLKNRMLEILGSVAVPQPFSKDYFSRTALPIDYDPQAKCPRFLDELIGDAVSDEDRVLLQKLAGQIVLGRNLTQRILVLYGNAGTGKSQLVNVLTGIVGRRNVVQLRTSQLGGRFETSRYLGSSLLVGPDVSPDFLGTPGAAYLKSLVGGDTLDCEVKGGNGVFPLKGEFNVMITSNQQLSVKIQGDIGAWRRRLVFVRYSGQPPKVKIPNFAELLLKREASGILNWCLAGLQMLQADIATTGDIVIPEATMSRVDAMLGASDGLRLFLKERVSCSPGGDLSAREVCDAFFAFCGDRGWQLPTARQVECQLPAVMGELFQATRSHDCQRGETLVRGYRNVAFKS